MIYILMVLISLMFAYLYELKKKRYFAIFSVVPVVIVSGFRYDVGTDYMFRYLPDFKYMLEGGEVSNLEWGFKIIVQIIQLFTTNFQVLLVCCAVLIYGLIYYNIYKYSNHIYLSILIFYIGIFFFDSLNVMRQYMAVTLLVCAYMNLLQDKIKKYFLYMLLAMIFHTMSIVFVIVFIPYVLRKNIKKLAILLVIPLAVMPVCKQLLQILLVNTKYHVYFTEGFEQFVTGDLQIVMLGLNAIILIVYMYIISQRKELLKNKEIVMYLFMQIVSTYICVYTGVLYIVFRFIYLFSVFQIWSIPLMLDNVESEKKRKLLTCIIMGAYIIAFSYLVLLNNTNEVLPYQIRLYVN